MARVRNAKPRATPEYPTRGRIHILSVEPDPWSGSRGGGVDGCGERMKLLHSAKFVFRKPNSELCTTHSAFASMDENIRRLS